MRECVPGRIECGPGAAGAKQDPVDQQKHAECDAGVDSPLRPTGAGLSDAMCLTPKDAARSSPLGTSVAISLPSA